MRVTHVVCVCHRPGVACSVTGGGEVIMRAGLARACGAALQAADAGEQAPCCSDACLQAIQRHVLQGQPESLPCPHRDCGILAITVIELDEASSSHGQPASAAEQNAADREEGSAGGKVHGGEETAGGCLVSARKAVEIELGVAHNSGSMAFGYWAHGMATPHTCILRQRRPKGTQAAARMCCEGARKRWRLPAAA